MPQRPLRVGLIGAGYIADWHAKALSAVEGVELAAVCDMDRWKAESLAEKHGAAVFTDAAVMLEGSSGGGEPAAASQRRALGEGGAFEGLDAVHVLLPPHLHYPLGKQVLEAGVSLLLEKPMCVEPEQCAELVELAKEKNVRLGVSHNFLFVPVYERLMADIEAGRLGLVDHVRVSWSRALPPLQFGPHGHWMFARPQNLLLEIGPHSFAHLLDLAGPPDELKTWASNPTVLDNGRTVYRRWLVDALCGPTAVQLDFSFVPGFDEHAIHVRGSMGNAHVDFVRNTYTLDQFTHLPTDFDAYTTLRRKAKTLTKQARTNLKHYALGKAGLSDQGNTFGASIAGSMRCFYRDWDGGPGALDKKISGESGRQVVALCQQVAEAAPAAPQHEAPEVSPDAVPAQAPGAEADVLVLGGSGFIGRAVVQKLLDAGRSVRVASRSASRGGLPGVSDPDGRLSVMRGDIRKPDDLAQLLDGITDVIHLAKATSAETWDQWYEQDVLATKAVAEACLVLEIRRLLYASSIAPLDLASTKRTVTHETAVPPSEKMVEVYARTKAASEEMLLRMYREQRLPVVIVRPGIVIGEGCTPFHTGVAWWTGGRVAQLWGDGRNKLPLVLVEDVADAMVAAIAPDAADDVLGKTLNLVAAPVLTAREYIEAMERAAGVKFEVREHPAWQSYLGELFKHGVKIAVRWPNRRWPKLREWQSRSTRSPFDTSYEREVLGWRPADDRETIVREGIAKPVQRFIIEAQRPVEKR